jgi:hypothetical protein
MIGRPVRAVSVRANFLADLPHFEPPQAGRRPTVVRLRVRAFA